MPEIIKEEQNKKGNRKIKLVKLDEDDYIVEYFKLAGPVGDQGLEMPVFEDAPMTYYSKKLKYDLQFEAKMLTAGGKKFSTLKEAEDNCSLFLTGQI